LATGINKLYENVSIIESECQDRFAEWFAFFLSQSEFDYDWPSWKEKADESQDHKDWLK